jgi:MFS family permease
MTQAAREPRPSARAWYALAVFIVATLVGFVDRQVLVLVAEPLKHEMGLNDGQLGVLQGLGPGLLGALGAVALGWLSDRAPRQLILAACIFAWSVATGLSGFAANFPELLLATMAIALGEAALGPIFLSMIPDLFPGKSRTTANLVTIGAVLLGVGIGVILGGGALAFVESHRAMLPAGLRGLAAWRIAFLLVALPGFPIALAVAAIGPVRRIAGKTAAQVGGSMRGYFRRYGVAMSGVYAATALVNLGVGAGGSWIVIYSMRTLKATPAQVGIGLGVAVAGGALAGVVLCGLLVRLLDRRLGRVAAHAVYQGAIAMALAMLILQFWARTPGQLFALYGLELLASTGAAALVPNMLQDISPGDLRGRIISLQSMVQQLATAIAPVLVGLLSDTMTGNPRSLIWAMVLIGAPAMAAGALCMRLTAHHFRKAADELAPA